MSGGARGEGADRRGVSVYERKEPGRRPSYGQQAKAAAEKEQERAGGGPTSQRRGIEKEIASETEAPTLRTLERVGSAECQAFWRRQCQG